MKNLKIKIVCMLIIVCFYNNLFSQSDITGVGTGHAGTTTTWYCGWDNTTTFPLNIEHQGTYNIKFKLGSIPSGQLDQSGNKNTTFGYYTFNSSASGTDNSLFGDHAGNGLSTGTYNTFMGSGAGLVNTNGSQNTFLGMEAGNYNTASDNTFTGFQSGLYNTVGVQNTYSGYRSGFGVNTGSIGSYNTFTGSESGKINSTGSYNTFSGYWAGSSNTTFDYNTYVGYESGQNATGNQNTFLGSQSGKNNSGAENAFMGESAGFHNSTGKQNTFLGEESGFYNTTGDYNVYVGHISGYNNKGDNNTFIGYGTDASPATLNHASAIGEGAIVTNSNTMILTDNTDLVGIGLSGFPAGPQAKLDVENDASLSPGGSSIAGRFITTGTSPSVVNWGVIGSNSAGNSVLNFGAAFDASRANLNLGVIGSANNITGGSNTGVYGQAENAQKDNIGVQGTGTSATGANNYGGKFQNLGNNTATNYGIRAEVQGISLGGGTGGVQNFGVFSIVYPGAAAFVGPAAVDVAVYGNCASSATPGVSPAITKGTTWAGYFDGDVQINGYGWLSSGPWNLSDQQFKTHIDSIPNSLSIIKNLKPRTYFMDTLNQHGLNFSSKRQYGFIAQEVQQILPELVGASHKPDMVDSLGNVITPGVSFIGLNYQEFIPLLTKGIQELSKTNDSLKTTNTKQDSINHSLQNQIDSIKGTNTAMQNQIDSIKGTNTAMQNQIDQLSQLINDCCNHNHSPINMNNNNGGDKSNIASQTDVKLTDQQSIVLDNAVPNPFAEQTTINYFLPDNTGKAQMLFYNAGGKLIQSVELTQKGQGQLNVFADDLSNGIYTYSLIVDGKIFATKKMVKQ